MTTLTQCFGLCASLLLAQDVLLDAHDETGATAHEHVRFALRIGVRVLELVDVDAGEVAEVDAVRRRGPGAGKKVGIGDLEPEAAPTTAGVPGQLNMGKYQIKR